jgi:hypothetical protein
MAIQTRTHVESLRRANRLRSAAARLLVFRRGVALPVLGIVVGISVAAAGLFGRGDPPQTRVPPGYAALVNGQGVLMSDFIAQAQAEMQKPFDETTRAERAHVLQEMIDKELLVQRALVLDLPETTTEVRTTMADAVDAQTAAPALAEQPTEAALFAYYRKHRSRYQSLGSMQFRDLVLHVGGYENTDQTFSQAQADAIEAVYQLRSGAPIDSVAEHFGMVDSAAADRGMQFDFAAKLHLGERLYGVASQLSTGQVSEPVAMPDGIHVIVMLNRQPPVVEDFPQARAQVYSDYSRWRVLQADQANLDILRHQARVLIAEGLAE